MDKSNLPERLQRDEAFGGYLGVEDIYDGETAKKIDLTKFDDIIKKSADNFEKSASGMRSIQIKRAHALSQKTKSIPKPKTSAPMHMIQGPAGKGSSQLSKQILKSRLDSIIKQVEQKGLKGGATGAIAGGLVGGIPGALIGGGLGDIGEDTIANKSKKMEKGSGEMSDKSNSFNRLKKPKKFTDYDPQNPPKGKKVSDEEKYKGFEKGIAGAAAGAGLGSIAGPAGMLAGGGLGSIAEDAARKKWNIPTTPIKGNKEQEKAVAETDKTKIGFHRDPKTGRYVRDAKSLLKSQALLSVEKAIYLMKAAVEGQEPNTAQPPQDWMTKCMQEIGDENQCMLMWTKQASQSQAPWQEEKTDSDPNLPGTQPAEPDGGAAQQGEVDYDGLGKWMGGALQGGTLSSLLGHPIAGQAIQAAGRAIGQKILGKEVNEEEAQKIGMAAFDAIEGVINESDDDSMKKAWPALAARIIPTLARGAAKIAPSAGGAFAGQTLANRIDQKSVAAQLDKKVIDTALPQRKPKSDFGGESEISGDGAKMDLRELNERSEVQDETGAKKIDAKKVAHNYKFS